MTLFFIFLITFFVSFYCCLTGPVTSTFIEKTFLDIIEGQYKCIRNVKTGLPILAPFALSTADIREQTQNHKRALEITVLFNSSQP